jgi:hypothetical protein
MFQRLHFTTVLALRIYCKSFPFPSSMADEPALAVQTAQENLRE